VSSCGCEETTRGQNALSPPAPPPPPTHTHHRGSCRRSGCVTDPFQLEGSSDKQSAAQLARASTILCVRAPPVPVGRAGGRRVPPATAAPCGAALCFKQRRTTVGPRGWLAARLCATCGLPLDMGWRCRVSVLHIGVSGLRGRGGVGLRAGLLLRCVRRAGVGFSASVTGDQQDNAWCDAHAPASLAHDATMRPAPTASTARVALAA
jgi:hypothetical protein